MLTYTSPHGTLILLYFSISLLTTLPFMVVLRLSRVGKKSHPTFRIIASDKHKDTVGSYLELLGSYDPHATPTRIEVKADRIKYWLSVGAQPSDTVHNLLVEKGVIDSAKRVIAKAAPAEVEAAAPVAAPAEAPVVEEKPAEAPVEAPADLPAGRQEPAPATEEKAAE